MMMAHSPPPLHGPETKRPKGILKNSSYQRSPPHKPVTVEVPAAAAASDHKADDNVATSPLTEKDIVLHNTLQNAGLRRRSSSTQSRISRRNSAATRGQDDESSPSPRLKWDEANLYLTEQERTAKMKITEPKTPYAKHYDPMEDEAEMSMLDAEQIVVDELDAARSPAKDIKGRRMREEDIPGLELGEPEEAIPENARGSHSPKQVVVRDDYVGDHHHGDDGDEPQTPEEEEKHRKFEEMRKKHYEMKDVANLLGHPEAIPDDDEDEDEDGDTSLEDAPNGVPDVPKIPPKFVNGDNNAGTGSE